MDIPEGLNVTSIETALNDVNYSIIGHELRITWMDETRTGFLMDKEIPLFNVIAIIEQPSREKKSFSLTLSPESHFIDINGNLLPGINLTLPSISLIFEDAIAFNAYPNPFCNQAMLELNAPEEGKLTIKLYDNTGRLVSEIENSIIPGGNHTSLIDGSSLVPGTYFYNVSFEGADVFMKTGTIIKSK
jgi:hypothetical protein